MAWYHVGNCDCPMGCCDCGIKTTEEKYAIFYDEEKLEFFSISGHYLHRMGQRVTWTSRDKVIFLSNETNSLVETFNLRSKL
jgi:hypothetical protein